MIVFFLLANIIWGQHRTDLEWPAACDGGRSSSMARAWRKRQWIGWVGCWMRPHHSLCAERKSATTGDFAKPLGELAAPSPAFSHHRAKPRLINSIQPLTTTSILDSPVLVFIHPSNHSHTTHTPIKPSHHTHISAYTPTYALPSVHEPPTTVLGPTADKRARGSSLLLDRL